MRVLAVDPGEVRIGLAISDPNGKLARPLQVIKHTNRTVDAASIAQLAVQNDVGLIIVGQSMNMDGTPSPSGRKAARLEEAIQMRCSIPTQLWDESFSTNDAQEIGLMLGKPKHQRRGHQDDLAAAVILQSYLDAH